MSLNKENSRFGWTLAVAAGSGLGLAQSTGASRPAARPQARGSETAGRPKVRRRERRMESRTCRGTGRPTRYARMSTWPACWQARERRPHAAVGRGTPQNRKDTLSKDDPESLCLPPGVPRMNTTPYPWTYFQTPKLMVIVYEGGAHIWRKIFLDGRGRTTPTWNTPGWEIRSGIGKAIRWWSKPSGRTISPGSMKAESPTPIRHEGYRTHHAPGLRASANREYHRRSQDIFQALVVHHASFLQRGELIEYICQENNKDVEHLVGK